MKKLLLFILIILFPIQINARQKPINATAAILVEQTTGRVLYAYNMHERRYPASMSKMLTALVAVEHLELNHVVTVGAEISPMPPGYATGIHFSGETITVHMLLKALIIRSGNESGRVLALEVARRQTGRENISYNEAKNIFSNMLNEKARQLGAFNTTFDNPYGLHSSRHYTTAYDLALIARAYMNNPILAEIAGIRTFEGDSLNNVPHPNPNVREHSWVNTNRMLPGQDLGHPHITGIRTGFTTPAGHCFAGSAYHAGLSLITIVFNSEDPGRWQDTRLLMDYGFTNFAFRDIAAPYQILDTMYIENPRRGGKTTLQITSGAYYSALLSHAEYQSITRLITYDPLLLVEPEEDSYDIKMLRAPIEAGEEVGTVKYMVNDQIVFQTPALAAATIYERTFDSDMDYYIAMIFGNIFTLRALPYWFGLFGTLFGIFGISVAISAKRTAKKNERWQLPERHRSKYDRR